MAAENNELIFKSTTLPNRSFLHFELMRQKGEFCDINFRIGNQTIAAHRVVLAAGIPYFHEMLCSKGTKPDRDEFDMPDIDSNAWKSLVDYAYNGEVKITLENVEQLLLAACVLNVVEVKHACCSFWAKHLRLDNAISIQDFASSHECTELARKVEHFLRENFESISNREDFLMMSFSHFSRLIRADDIKVSTEEKVFEAVMRWIKKDPENRKEHLPRLLRKVRLPLLKPDYLRRIVLGEELIHQSILCRDLITEARDYHTLPEAEKLVCDFSSEPRNFSTADRQTKENENIICVICTELSLTVNHFNPLTEEWSLKENRLYPIDGDILESINRELFYFYGTNVLTCISPDYAWNSCSRRYSRHFAAAAALGNEIFICGGINGDSPCNIVECFDTKSREWTTLARMNVSRTFSSAASLQGHLYVMGGMNGCSVLDSVERYSPLTKIWKVMSPMLTKRWGLSCAVLNDKIYVNGGLVPEAEEKCVSTVEVYDPVANQWAFVSSMNIPRWLARIIPYGGKLYAIGGKDNEDKYVNIMEIYDSETDQWKLSTLACFQCPTLGTVLRSTPVS